MKRLTDSPVGEFLCRLFGAQIKTEYQVSMSLYPEKEATNPTCTHSCEGSSKHSLSKVLAWVALIIVVYAIVRGICGLLSKLFRTN